MDIALQENDPDELGLFVVAPHVPAAETDPTPKIHGKNFSRYGGDYCHWLHRLVHEELPKVFEARGQAVETNRFYLYGQSKGGEFVQHYIMTFGGVDIFRAAAAAGRCGKNSDNPLEDMTWSRYYPVLDSLIKTPVVLIVGYKDSAACGEGEILIHPDDFLKAQCVTEIPLVGEDLVIKGEKRWRRIEDLQRFICFEVRLRVHPEDFALLTVPPPSSTLRSGQPDYRCYRASSGRLPTLPDRNEAVPVFDSAWGRSTIN